MIIFKQIEHIGNYFSIGHQVKREVRTGMANIKQDPQKKHFGIAKKECSYKNCHLSYWTELRKMAQIHLIQLK